MSFLEVRDRGLPYGGIPYEELLNKLEETDMNETIEDIENNYKNYIRSEIVDRTLEKPFLESDKTKRDGSLSKSILNLRYNGSRGEYERPSHPELFMGFMDQDNRALDNNPRMDEYKKQIDIRMPNLEIRMGKNCTDIDHESPWTNQSLGQCRRDIQTSLAYNTKIFTDERDGRALNRNFVTEYDHNKKQLIYKDVLPNTINGITETSHGKTNLQYTTSAVPFVSTDINFTPSYKNIGNYIGLPGDKSCQRHISKDQITQDELMNAKSGTYILQSGSKMNTSKSDQQYNDHFDNYTSGYMPGTKYSAGNIDASVEENEIENTEFASSKTAIINPITNSKLIDNDPSFHESTYTDNRRIDVMRHANGNNFIKAELYPNDIVSSETEIKKSVSLWGNNNNITLVNSAYYIPEFTFKNLEIAKHAQFPDNQTVINKISYDMPYGSQEETRPRVNRYRFTDDVANVMKYSTATVPDTSSETLIRANAPINQEHKMKTTNGEDVWAASDENNFGKMQKQSRTGGIEPVVIEVPESHDIEASNGGSIIGKKSIRGDKVSSDHLNSMSENLIYDEF